MMGVTFVFTLANVNPAAGNICTVGAGVQVMHKYCTNI